MKLTILAVAILFACARPATEHDRVVAAAHLAELYAKSAAAAPWEVDVRAAGTDCSTLMVFMKAVADDSMIESLHYGAGVFDVMKDEPGAMTGGAGIFARYRGFAGVVYEDGGPHHWAQGKVRGRDVGPLHRLERDEADGLLGRIMICN